MSDSPRKPSHVAAFSAVPLEPRSLPSTVTIRQPARRKKLKQIPLLQVATSNSTVLKHPALRAETRKTSLHKAYSAPNRSHALREGNKEINTMSSPSTANSIKVRPEPSHIAFSQIPGAYPTSSEESTSTRSVSSTSGSGTVTSESVTHRATVNPATLPMAPSPLDKELPAKPIPRDADSPEQRGIYDATDANAQLIPFPSLTPQASEASLRGFSTGGAGGQAYDNDSDASTLQDIHGNDQTSPTDDITQEYVETTLQVLEISASKSKLQENLKTTRTVSTLPRSPGMKSIAQPSRRVPISAGGSPQSRDQKAKLKVSKNTLRSRYQSTVDNTENASQIDKALGEPKATEEDTWRLTSDDEDAKHDITTRSPIRVKDDVRRSQLFNVGPTVRYSVDARQVIMGDSNELKLLEPIDSLSDEYKLSRAISTTKSSKQKLANLAYPTGSEDHKKSPSVDTSNHPPRMSSLQASDHGMRTKSPPIYSRLARPTASSAARETASKAIVEKNKALNDAKARARTPSRLSTASHAPGKPSVGVPTTRKSLPDSGTLQSVRRAGKGLRSRFSNILGNRKSSNKTIPSRTSLLSERNNVQDFLAGSSTASKGPQRKGSRNLTTYENSGMSRTTSQIIRPYEKSVILEDLVEPTPVLTTSGQTNPQGSHKFLEVSETFKSEIPALLPRLGSYSALGPLPSPLAALEAERSGDLTDTTLHEAQDHLMNIMKHAENITDIEGRKNLVAIIEMLGVSIAQARELRIATLTQISENLAIATKVREFGERVLVNL